jgi:glycosyltransferase involved in cell wall biosynthesis
MTRSPAERLKVAFVAPSLRILGGQAVQADRLLRAWRSDPDVEAWLVPVNPPPPGMLRALVSIKYLRTIVTEAVYLPLLLRELAKADVVHVFSASYTSFLLAPLPALTVARALGKPAVLNYRSGEAPDHLRRSAIARRVIRSVDRNVVPSSFLQEVFAGFGIASDVIPNLVDVDSFRYRERAVLRPRLVSTRNFDALYNVACTLRAFEVVQARWPEATLTLVGCGSEEASLRALARQLALRNVEFVGRVAPDAIASYYADADIYVQSPNIDNMPTSVLEAFASGLPVVSTRAGGIPAIVADGEHGFLVAPGDHLALANRVLRLLDDPRLALDMARRAHATCANRTWPAVRDRWLAVYHDVAAHPSGVALATERP